MSQLSTIIEQAFENRANFTAVDCPAEVRQAVEEAIAGLDNGTLRVAEKIDGEWIVHQWLKKAVLLSFKLNDNKPIESCDLRFYDKVETKFTGWTEEQFKAAGVRVVPPAVARKGSFQAKKMSY
jgi:2,3,4,5-tetrahydropyridine-2-carboxylate N-succinyltransferase